MGEKIQFYRDEHPPPHFHAEYAGHRAVIDIHTLSIVTGHLPKPQLKRVVSWAAVRQDALYQAWMRCAADERPGRIE